MYRKSEQSIQKSTDHSYLSRLKAKTFILYSQNVLIPEINNRYETLINVLFNEIMEHPELAKYVRIERDLEIRDVYKKMIENYLRLGNIEEADKTQEKIKAILEKKPRKERTIEYMLD